jgi:quercetin dioxygenase-like cupin family protein
MKKALLSLGLLCVALAASAIASASMSAPTVVMPDSVKWSPMSGMKGVWSATLYGTPSKAGSGQYAERLKFSDGVKIPVHYHPQPEQVTVISGTLMVGVGSKWDASKLTALGPGSYVAIPAMLKHYAQAKGETIVEIHGDAPDAMMMVKPGM